MNKYLKKYKFLIILISIAGILLLAHPIYLRAMGNFLIVGDELQKADAILVLSGDNPKGERLKYGVKLLKDKWADKLVLSGNYIAWETNLADIMERQSVSLGVDKNKIIKVRHRADSTLEESRLIAKKLQAQGIKKIIVVTSNFHTRRARRVLNKGFNGKIRIIIYSITDTYYFPDPDNWWKSRIQAKTLVLEMFKNLWSVLEN